MRCRHVLYVEGGRQWYHVMLTSYCTDTWPFLIAPNLTRLRRHASVKPQMNPPGHEGQGHSTTVGHRSLWSFWTTGCSTLFKHLWIQCSSLPTPTCRKADGLPWEGKHFDSKSNNFVIFCGILRRPDMVTRCDSTRDMKCQERPRLWSRGHGWTTVPRWHRRGTRRWWKMWDAETKALDLSMSTSQHESTISKFWEKSEDTWKVRQDEEIQY